MKNSRFHDGTGAGTVRRKGRVAFGLAALALFGVGASSLTTGCGGSSDGNSLAVGLPTGKATLDQVQRGRQLVVTSGCGDCHGRGGNDPSAATWLSGYHAGDGPGVFQLGPATTIYAANITPDATGIAGDSDQAIFNVLRHGWDPDSPAAGPQEYVAPIMPWASFRHLSDADTWAIVAYIKHGLGAVSNTVPDNAGEPPDHWAAASSEAAVGPAATPAFPSGNEHFMP